MQIFSELEPSDLLRLSRTSKDIRSFLMSKNSAIIWKAARKNVEGFPDCPEDLNEPQFANLAFSSHCHVRSWSILLVTATNTCVDMFATVYIQHRLGVS